MLGNISQFNFWLHFSTTRSQIRRNSFSPCRPFPAQHCVTTGKHRIYIRVGYATCGSDVTEWNRWKTRGEWEDSSEPDPLLSDLRNVETTPMAGCGSILLEKRVNKMFLLSLTLADAQHSDPLYQRCSYKSHDTVAWIIAVVGPLRGPQWPQPQESVRLNYSDRGGMGLWECTCGSGIRGIQMTV